MRERPTIEQETFIETMNRDRKTCEQAKIYPDIMSERRFRTTPASMCFMGNMVDAPLLPFLRKLNSFHWIVSTSSCSGHDDNDPSIGVAVKRRHIDKFVDLMLSLTSVLDEQDYYVSAELDCYSNVGCWFEEFPDWLMFSIDFFCKEKLTTDAAFWNDLTNQIWPTSHRGRRVPLTIAPTPGVASASRDRAD